MKYKKIIVCVDKEKHLEYATTIVTYLSSLGIKTSLRIGCIEGCILPEYKKHKNTVFVCLSPVHYLFYNKKNRLGCMSDKYIIDDEVLKLLKTKKLSDINISVYLSEVGERLISGYLSNFETSTTYFLFISQKCKTESLTQSNSDSKIVFMIFLIFIKIFFINILFYY